MLRSLHLRIACLILPTLFFARKPAQVGPDGSGGYLVATLQTVHPTGDVVAWGGRPVDMALSADGKTLFVKDNRGLVVVDAQKNAIRQELPFPNGGGSMHGIACAPDGRHVYLTTAQNELWEAELETDGRQADSKATESKTTESKVAENIEVRTKAVWKRKIILPGLEGKGAAHGCGIALSRDEKTAFVCLSRGNSLGVVDLAVGKLTAEIAVGVAPYAVCLSPDGKTALVSDWGGRRAGKADQTAPSAGTPTRIDARGIASDGCVSVVNLETQRETAQIVVGLHPSGMVLNREGSRLYVANANSDTVSVIDVRTQRVVETLSTHSDANMPFGSMPNALALSSEETMLYVANGGNNAVAVIALAAGGAKRSQVRGLIPAGWYPGALALASNRLYIANIKGFGSRHTPDNAKGANVYQYLGTISSVPLPDAAALRRYTAQARTDGKIRDTLRHQEALQKRADMPLRPVPQHDGEPSTIAHVVYILKENRTYDQVLGDMAQANGDPKLTIYGRDITPNHHALAEQFVLLDNYYCNGVLSADGHSWATEGNVTDHLEKSFGGFTRSYTFGDDPLTYSSSGFLWDGVLAAGLTFRNYGEMDYAETVPKTATFKDIYTDFQNRSEEQTSPSNKKSPSPSEERAARRGAGVRFTHSIGIANLRRYTHPDYPGWNLRIPDVLRADIFLTDLKQYEANNNFPNLTLIYLPNDHTSGTSPNAPTPRAQLADNDLALGRIVEGLSKSRFWPNMCIFVNEDDPQDGFDHVDGHRSLCLVVSPYARRNAVISATYNQTSALHTMERMLGVLPMNQMDALAPVMQSCFTDKPDLTPYACLPNRVPLDEFNPALSRLPRAQQKWARLSARMDWSRPDAMDDDLLNQILWHDARPEEPSPQSHRDTEVSQKGKIRAEEK